MTHLTDEQLEEILLSGLSEPDHLAACPQCQARWREKIALRRRLQTAFSGIHASAELAARIRTRLNPPSTPKRLGSFPTFYRTAGLAVAAGLIVVISLILFYANPSFENVAQAELVRVHQKNLSDLKNIYENTDPVKMANHLATTLGYAPQAPGPSKGISLRGCCVRTFRQKPVATYVLGTSVGTVSIIVINEHPQTLGLTVQTGCEMCKNCQCWVKSMKKANVAAVRRGDYSYYAVGNLPQEKLSAILMTVYPPDTM